MDGLARGRPWCTEGRRPYADIWVKIWSAIEDRGGLDVNPVVKVKAHSTIDDVSDGKVSVLDRLGNNEADRAAKLGAALHRKI